jgi:proteasome accessory factor B
VTERTDRTERLLNLVFALMASPRAVPRAVIRSEVPGYADAASDAAFERMFERDKDELRSMGVPVETVIDDFGDVLGYRIPRDDYAMEPIDLTIEERSALAVAAQIWGRAAMAPLAGTALRKLEAIGGDAEAWLPATLRGEVHLGSSEAALLPLMQAIRTKRIVTFDYQAPSADTPARRTLSPWRLVALEGLWRVVGYDHDREATRTFRLSRIHGQVVLTGRERIEPETQIVPEDEPATAGARALVRLAPGRAAGLRRAAIESDDPWQDDDLEVEFPTREGLVRAICAAGPDAVVLQPPDVVSTVAERLHMIAAQHATGAR